MTATDMLGKVATGQGFIAALDQSGGSTPKALAQYGVAASEYSGEDEMFDQVHAMRTRIMTSPAFSGERILGAILFEGTMDRSVEGLPTATYLWQERGVVPFLKVDQGLADERDGVQLMKDIPGLDALLARARDAGVFGTKMRSVIKTADPVGVQRVVDQQFAVGLRIVNAGLMPILEPEVDINAPDKAEAEAMLRDALLAGLDAVPASAKVMFKLTLPDEDGFYAALVAHPRVLRVVALSGGYARDEANARLARNSGVIASFSRALVDGLSAQMDDAEFDATLDASIASIHAASIT
ncbi:MAG: fructose bisphosphate aldolase [Actinomycetota bacterium]|nr:fructose bisphosphate aldolase [Actinomycetota bacterium]